MNYEYAGKWKWNMYDEGNLIAVVEANQGGQLDKYACLFAAAPELLQVAEDYVLLCKLHDLEGGVLDSALAAIAKARGAHEHCRT